MNLHFLIASAVAIIASDFTTSVFAQNHDGKVIVKTTKIIDGDTSVTEKTVDLSGYASNEFIEVFAHSNFDDSKGGKSTAKKSKVVVFEKDLDFNSDNFNADIEKMDLEVATLIEQIEKEIKLGKSVIEIDNVRKKKKMVIITDLDYENMEKGAVEKHSRKVKKRVKREIKE